MITIGSLFSGIGGLELGLEWAGLGPVKWQVEREEFCRAVLAKHWPAAARYEDVCSIGAKQLEPVDLICGGFPCQDISNAGKQAGITGERSGLWREYARIVRELRPRFVVVENVAALTVRGLDTVLGDLATLGYDAWWDCLRASDVGAPHRRERVFVVAHARGQLRQRRQTSESRGFSSREAGLLGTDGADALADPDGQRKQQPGEHVSNQRRRARDHSRRLSQSSMGRIAHGIPRGLDGHWPAGRGETQYPWEPPRTAPKIPRRRDRLKALGNAVVPQCAYVIGCVVQALAQEGS